MRSRLPGTLLLVCTLAASPDAARSAEPGLVDRILAVVDERPLLLSSVRTLEAVRGLDRAAALEAVIDERLMFREASRLPQAQVSAEEEERALASFRAARDASEPVATETELRRLLRRQLAILKYVEFRFRPQVRISEEELREAWNVGFLGQPEGPAFEEAAPALRERLERGELDRRIEAWVRDLRERADVRYVEGPGSPSRSEPSGP